MYFVSFFLSMIIYEFLYTWSRYLWYNICSTWFLDIRISTFVFGENKLFLKLCRYIYLYPHGYCDYRWKCTVTTPFLHTLMFWWLIEMFCTGSLLCVCMCVCTCVCMCVFCVYIYVYIYLCMCVRMCMRVCLCMCVCMLYVCTNIDCIIIMYTYVAMMLNLRSPAEDTVEPMETGQIVFNWNHIIC